MRKECWNCKNHGTEFCEDCFVSASQKTPSNWQPGERYVPDTNADRIRTASDEELAEMLMNIYRSVCNEKQERRERCSEYGCKDCIQEWLQQPVKEE